MFCIKSDVITLGSIEMYGLVIIWTSMDDGPYSVILLKYGSHDMRHIGFCRLTGQRDPRVLGCYMDRLAHVILELMKSIIHNIT